MPATEGSGSLLSPSWRDDLDQYRRHVHDDGANHSTWWRQEVASEKAMPHGVDDDKTNRQEIALRIATPRRGT